MFTPFANLNVRVGADIKEFQAMASKMEKALAPVRQRLQSVGTALSVGVTAPLTALAVKGVQAWDKQAKAVAKVENAIRSTGGAAGRSLEELQRLASDLQTKTLFGDEEILEGATAQLLTFTNIAGQQFERTQAVALDLATMLGTDLKSASIQLGKALNDPVANLSALSRSGIQFSASQKEVIKSLAEGGRLAEAQNVILQELERQYGGTAEAAAKAGTGPITQLSNAIGDLTEEIGAIVVDAIQPLVGYVQEAVTWFGNLSEGTKQTIVAIGGIAAAIGPLLLSLGGVLKLLPLISTGFTLLTGPFGLVIAGGAALVAGAVAIYKNWDRIREQFAGPLSKAIAGFSAVFETVKAVAMDILGSVMQLVSTFGEWFSAIWGEIVSAAKAIWAEWGDTIMTAVRFVFDHVISIVTTALSLLADTFGAFVDFLTGDWAGLWERMQNITRTITRFIARSVLSMADLVLAGIEKLFSWIPGVESLVGKARQYIQDLRDDFAQPIVLGPVVQSGGSGSAGAFAPPPKPPVAPTGSSTAESSGIPVLDTMQGAGLQSLDVTLPPVDGSQLVASVAEVADTIAPEMTRLQEYFIQTNQRFQEVVPQMADTIASGFADAATGLLEGVGRMLVGAQSAGGIVNGLLSTLADLAIRVGKIAIGVGLGVEGIKKALQPPFPAPVAIAAGAALVALGSAAKAALSKAASGSGGSAGSVGASAGFGEQSVFQNANRSNSTNNAERERDIPEVRVVMESSVTPAGDIEYSFRQGSRRLARQGTDVR